MARAKRNSKSLNQAIQRAAGMRSIDPSLYFGDGLSLSEYNIRIQTLQAQLSQYNHTLASLDEMAETIAQTEQDLKAYSEKMLLSAAARYGKESAQYMTAGGTIRKRSPRRSKNAIENTTLQPIMIVPSPKKAATNGKGSKVVV
jgi:hypothetical protein